MQLKMKSKKKFKILLIFLVLSLIPLIQALEIENQTTYHSVTSGSMIRFEQNTTVDSPLNLTSDWLEIYNLQTDNPIFKNINDTNNGQIHFFNLTNALVYSSNGSVAGSTTISNNDGNINISFSPNNYSYVLNDFSLTTASRVNSPLWISSQTFITDENNSFFNYNLSSNLSDSINISFYPGQLSLENLKEIRYTSNTSSSYTTLSFTISGNYIDKILIDNYEPAINSNYLQLVYNILSNENSGSSLSTTLGCITLTRFDKILNQWINNLGIDLITLDIYLNKWLTQEGC